MLYRPPTPDAHDPAIARMAAAAEQHRIELDGRPNEAGDSFVRYWPPNPGNGSPADGNSLGFLRYLSRDPTTALQCDCPGGYSLTLDRAYTAPNATVGVAFLAPSPFRSNWVIMAPGDTIYVPGGFERFWLFNADQYDRIPTYGTLLAYSGLGYCSFLVGTRRNGAAPLQSVTHPIAKTVFVASGGTGLFGYVPIGRMRHLGLEANSYTGTVYDVLGNTITTLSLQFMSAHDFSGSPASAGTLLAKETIEAVGAWQTNYSRVRAYPIYTVSGGGQLRLTVPTGGMMRIVSGGTTSTTQDTPTGIVLRVQGYPD